MANLTINETTVTNRRIEPFNKIIVLEAGDKLADTAALITLANKTCPTGYRITARITINIDKIEKL